MIKVATFSFAYTKNLALTISQLKEQDFLRRTKWID